MKEDSMSDLDQIRTAAVDRIERSARNFKLAFLAAGVVEALFMVAFLATADFHVKLHVLLLIATIGSYTIIILGLVALGAFLERGNLRVLKAIELLAAER
jgi:hypothetical protein